MLQLKPCLRAKAGMAWALWARARRTTAPAMRTISVFFMAASLPGQAPWRDRLDVGHLGVEAVERLDEGHQGRLLVLAQAERDHEGIEVGVLPAAPVVEVNE